MFVMPLAHSARIRRATPIFSRTLDRLFDESLERQSHGTPATGSARAPAMDVVETDAGYAVVFDMPGASKDQLKVSVEGRRVTVETTAQGAERPDGERMLYRERPAARYARTLSLPAEVDHNASQAKFENGVLTLTLVKKALAGATQLQVN